jgi:hypothetical protein
MRVETYRRATGEKMVEIQIWPSRGVNSLTLQEACELRQKLSAVLDGILCPPPSPTEQQAEKA